MQISVVIPTFNRERWLQEALASVAAQTLPPVQTIVVDDGSTDGTRKFLAAESGRILALYQANSGAAAARNFGLASVTTPWVAFLDSDDLWEPTKLEEQVRALAKHPGARLAIVDSRAIDFEGRALPGHHRPVRGGDVTSALFQHTFVHTPAVLAETALLRTLGGFDASLRVAEDYDLWLKASLVTPFALAPAPLLLRRVHALSLAHQPNPEHADDKCRVLERFAACPEAMAKLTPTKIRRRLARAHFQAARIHRVHGKRADAKPHLDRCVALEPWNLRARLLRWRER